MREIIAEQLDRHGGPAAGFARRDDVREEMSRVVPVRLLAAGRDYGRAAN